MDAIQKVMSRRSIRRYTQAEVPEEAVRQLLQAAMSAPSACNVQPWQFVVIRRREILNSILSFHPNAQMLKEAALSIVVCGDLNLNYKGFWVQDCSAATQNILIAAHALGLGAVWLGIYPLEERIAGFKRLLSLPDRIIPLSMVSIGWPAEHPAPATRYREDRVHYDVW